MTVLAPPNPALPEQQESRGGVRPIRCVLCGVVVAYSVGPPERRELRRQRPCRIDGDLLLWATCEPACPAVGGDAA